MGCAAALLLCLPAPILADSGGIPLPVLSKGKGEQCVEPVPDIRRNHMRYLMHQRDETVHRGIRTKRHSLRECIACHAETDAQGQAMPVNAPGQFCQSCHSYAAVKMDCFQCHATVPGAGQTGVEINATFGGSGELSMMVGGQFDIREGAPNVPGHPGVPAAEK